MLPFDCYLLSLFTNILSVKIQKKFLSDINLLAETFVTEIGRHFDNQCHCLLRLAVKIYLL